MKLGRVVIPTVATVGVILLGVVAVALVARGVLASEPASEPDPTPTPASVVDSSTESTPVPEVTVDLADTPKEITLELPVLPDKSLSPKSQTAQRSTGAVRVLSHQPIPRARPTHGRTATERSMWYSRRTWSSRRPPKSLQLMSWFPREWSTASYRSRPATAPMPDRCSSRSLAES